MRKLIVKSVRKEILFQLGRLKHHPSVFVWSANNENELGINEWFHGKANRSKYHSDYLTLYKDLLGDTVSKVDFKSRPFLLSSPTNGVETFQVGGISENPNSEFYGDMHYYTFSDMWPPFEPPVARCISEFGFQSLPFVETLKSAGFEQKDFNFNSQSLLHRQHHSLAHASMASRNLFYVSLTFLNRSSWIQTLVVLPSVQYSRKWTKRDANIPSRSRAARCPELSKSIVSLDDEFTLRTDHGSLRWLQSFRDPDGQWARWQEKLQRFRFKIVHRPGKQHSNAEGLSRMTCKQCGRKDEQLVVDEPLAFDPVNAIALTAVDDIRLKQKHDPDISELLTAKLANDPALLPNQRTKIVSILAANWDRLCVKDGILWRKWYNADGSSHLQLVVPKEMISQVWEQSHSASTAGHLGEEKTLACVCRQFYCPGYRTDVKHYIKTCWECNTRDDPIPKGRALLQPQTAHYTWQKLAEDIAGPLPTTPRGNRYILIVPDASKFIEAIPMPNQEAEKDVIHVVHEDRLKHCRSDLRLPPRHNTTRPPRMSAPPAMQQKSWIRTYCDPEANAPRPPELVFLDPMNPLPRQLSSPSASPPAVERSKRHSQARLVPRLCY
uniref:Integrase_H2C2 domain-containing protein n=1 Tax=Trichuris muris TaxID=70415 RepID=A0A5S6Q0L9_TRIMR